MILGKLGLDELAPATLSFYTFLATIPLAAFAMRLGAGWRGVPAEWRGRSLILAHAAGSLFAIWLLWEGLARLDATVAAFLNRTETLLAVLLGLILLGERFRPAEAAGAAVAVGGVALLMLPEDGIAPGTASGAGFWLVITSSFFFAVTEYVSKIAIRHVPPTVLAFYRSVVLAPAFAMIALLRGELTLASGRTVLIVLGLALLGPVLARILYLQALRSLELGKAAVVTQSQPLFAAVLALLVLGDDLDPTQWLGGLLIVAGCVGLAAARPRVSGRS